MVQNLRIQTTSNWLYILSDTDAVFIAVYVYFLYPLTVGKGVFYYPLIRVQIWKEMRHHD